MISELVVYEQESTTEWDGTDSTYQLVVTLGMSHGVGSVAHFLVKSTATQILLYLLLQVTAESPPTLHSNTA